MEDALVLAYKILFEDDFYVLILVLMEDALVRTTRGLQACITEVLILVLMEDALVLTNITTWQHLFQCLNPCFNGRCTSTFVTEPVLDEYGMPGLNPCFNGRCTSTPEMVGESGKFQRMS